MGNVGFKSVGDNAGKETDSLEKLSKVLQEVEDESRRLEDDLKAEISTVEQLKANLKILEEQVVEAEAYLQQRRKLVMEVLAMEFSTQFDVTEARNNLNKISHFDQIIAKKISVVSSEIRRYILNETTQILTEIEPLRTTLRLGP